MRHFVLLFVLLFAMNLQAQKYNEGEAPFAINGVDVPQEKDDKLYEPQIKGEYQTLYFPKNATYMNDHSVYVDNEGKWHIIGIGNDLPYEKFPSPFQKEVQFVHGVADELMGPYTDLEPVSRHKVNPELHGIKKNPAPQVPSKPKGKKKKGKKGKKGKGGVRAKNLKQKLGEYYPAWAPHTIKYNKECWIFYAPSNFFIEKSKDMKNWEVVNHYMNDLPIPGPFEINGFDHRNGGADIRDYMLLRLSETKWVLYHTGIDKATKSASVTIYESENGLTNWKYKGEALTFKGVKTKAWSSAESPFVFKKGDYFYMSLTYTSTGGGYHQTLMFRSKDPYNFGNYGGDVDQVKENFVAGLGAHAPEIIYEPKQDKWYLTSCGWSWSRVKKLPQAKGGLAIAELEWKEKGTFLNNHDFEYGTLTGWKKTGNAFNISLANFEYKGELIHQNGAFFISSYFGEFSKEETFKKGGFKENPNTGTLESGSFKLGGKIIDFLVMGAKDEKDLYVALVDAKSGKVLQKATGNGKNTFERITWDVKKFKGKQCKIKIVDNSVDLKGHISVDDINLTIDK